MLDTLPSELLHRIIIYASPIISLSVTPLTTITNGPERYFDVTPPSIVANLALTCSTLYKVVKFTDNAWLYSKIFERTFDFDAARRRLGIEWAGAHGLTWEGRKRWGMIQRMKNAVRIWERDGAYSFRWIDEYGEEDIRMDLWTIYLMLLENDGKNGVLLTIGAKLGQLTEMLCRLHFGKRMVRRVGWPMASQERALLAWILYALDPMPSDFLDQDLYHQTKLCMRAFIFASFKYSLGILPPTYFIHPSANNPSHYQHQVPATELSPYPLNPLSSARYASWTPPPDPPTYKYSNDHLTAIIIYARTVYLYPPSLATAALLWYFRGSNTIVSPPVSGSPQDYSGSEGGNQGMPGMSRQGSGMDASSTSTDSTEHTGPSSSNSYPNSATRSMFSALRTDPHSWTTPLLFSIPLTPPNIPQSSFNKAFRNELYRRKFNAASRQMDQEWTRRVDGQMRFNGPNKVEGFVPGSLEGVWEGGFLYLDFPDYAQFLTGEREATPAFYQLPPDKIYGSNRQVWRLKEYELQTFVDDSEPSQSVNGDTIRKEYGSPNYGAQNFSTGMGMSSSLNSSGSNQPLSVGKWMDGWLPPADRLKWRFPDDGDELEIVEVVKPDTISSNSNNTNMRSTTNAQRTTKIRRTSTDDTAGDSVTLSVSSTNPVVTVSSNEEEDGDDETEEGWSREKQGLVGKIRGRSSARKGKGKSKPAALEIQSPTSVTYLRQSASSITPVRGSSALPLSPSALPVLSPASVVSPASARSDAPLSSNLYGSMDPRTLSPPPTSPPISRSLSPPAKDKGIGRRFSWGWKVKKKDEKAGKGPKAQEKRALDGSAVVQTRPIESRPQTISYQSPLPEPLIYTRSPRENTLVARQDTFDSLDAGINDNLDQESEVNINAAEDAEDINNEPEVIERVSRYVRWDPNVAWAKQAIWGGSTGSSQQTRPSSQAINPSRGMTASTTGTSASAPGSSGMVPSAVGTGLSKSGSGASVRGQRQIRDILVFGESHSAWGEATIRGRIRSHDGLITLVKTYPQRATWIYTGYVIAGESFVGRWRDANSPEEVNGYEGPFAMKRRR